MCLQLVLLSQGNSHSNISTGIIYALTHIEQTLGDFESLISMQRYSMFNLSSQDRTRTCMIEKTNFTRFFGMVNIFNVMSHGPINQSPITRLIRHLTIFYSFLSYILYLFQNIKNLLTQDILGMNKIPYQSLINYKENIPFS